MNADILSVRQKKSLLMFYLVILNLNISNILKCRPGRLISTTTVDRLSALPMPSSIL